jgi:hypothetical protein
MPICQNIHDPAQRQPSRAADTEGRDPRAVSWAAPGAMTACGHLLYKGRESELLPRDALAAGHRRARCRPGGSYATTA